MDSNTLTIGYAGILNGYAPSKGSINFFPQMLKRIFFSYRVNNISNHTRTGYFLFQGIKYLKKNYPINAKRLKVELWGIIDPLNKQQVEEYRLTDIVSIGGYLSKSESFKKLMKCDILFLPLESALGEQRPLFIPGKLYEYLKTGKPILALAEDSDCSVILKNSGLGIICSPYKASEIANYLNYLIENKDSINEIYKGNESYIQSNFNFIEITKKMAEVFNNVLGGK